MGISIELPTYILVDYQSVICNTSKAHPSLKNKSCSISFHFVCGGTAKDEWQTAYINTHSNPDDMFTNSLSDPYPSPSDSSVSSSLSYSARKKRNVKRRKSVISIDKMTRQTRPRVMTLMNLNTDLSWPISKLEPEGVDGPLFSKMDTVRGRRKMSRGVKK